MMLYDIDKAQENYNWLCVHIVLLHPVQGAVMKLK